MRPGRIFGIVFLIISIVCIGATVTSCGITVNTGNGSDGNTTGAQATIISQNATIAALSARTNQQPAVAPAPVTGNTGGANGNAGAPVSSGFIGGNTITSNSQSQQVAGWYTSCDMIKEAGDGSIFERPVPSSPYECDFRPSVGGALVFHGVNATLTCGGVVVASRVDPKAVQIQPGVMCHASGGDKNGGFSLERG